MSTAEAAAWRDFLIAAANTHGQHPDDVTGRHAVLVLVTEHGYEGAEVEVVGFDGDGTPLDKEACVRWAMYGITSQSDAFIIQERHPSSPDRGYPRFGTYATEGRA
jgi:hypothetical protein